jgi:hypothetical protein
MERAMNAPIWLPQMMDLSSWTNECFDVLYDVFERDFVNSPASYRGNKVWFFPETEAGKPSIFWHLTSREDKATGERLPDFRRAERLPWSRPMLDNAEDPAILAWDYQEDDGAIKTYVWLRDHDFVVIMKKMADKSRRLITSFWLEYGNTKRKMMKKYENRISTGLTNEKG